MFSISATGEYTSNPGHIGETIPLHSTEELKAAPTSQIEHDVLDSKTQAYIFPERKQDPQTVYRTIHDQLILDGNSQQNLATFCTTWIEPEVKQLMDESADKNMIDKDEYPQTAAIEERCTCSPISGTLQKRKLRAMAGFGGDRPSSSFLEFRRLTFPREVPLDVQRFLADAENDFS